MDKNAFETLACPVNHMPVRPAERELLVRLNRAVAAGRIRNQAGRMIETAIADGLVRQDGALLYPILDDIPVMLADEGIAMDQLAATRNGENR
jgi:uncharacterized protein YbaR (Trm112 family)